MKLFLPIAVATAALLCGGCTTATHSAQGKVYSGIYFYNFETSSFTPDGSQERWCLSGEMEQAMLPAESANGPEGTAHVVVRGVLSPPGHYCNLGASKYVLTVDQVLEVSDKRAQEP